MQEATSKPPPAGRVAQGVSKAARVLGRLSLSRRSPQPMPVSPLTTVNGALPIRFRMPRCMLHVIPDGQISSCTPSLILMLSDSASEHVRRMVLRTDVCFVWCLATTVPWLFRSHIGSDLCIAPVQAATPPDGKVGDQPAAIEIRCEDGQTSPAPSAQPFSCVHPDIEQEHQRKGCKGHGGSQSAAAPRAIVFGIQHSRLTRACCAGPRAGIDPLAPPATSNSGSAGAGHPQPAGASAAQPPAASAPRPRQAARAALGAVGNPQMIKNAVTRLCLPGGSAAQGAPLTFADCEVV